VKSEKEAKRYTVENCSLNAKFIREKDPNSAFDFGDLKKGEDDGEDEGENEDNDNENANAKVEE